jgi:hypothetical protein
MAEAEVQHSRKSFNQLTCSTRVSCSRRICPHLGAGAGRLSAYSVRLPFAGEDRSGASDAGQSRAVCVAPSASLALRLKAPPSLKTPERVLAGAGRTTRSSVCSGSVPCEERRTGANGLAVAYSNRSCGAQMSSKERRCINELESTGSPVCLQACYKGSLASLPANSLQCEGESEKVWLTRCDGGGR